MKAVSPGYRTAAVSVPLPPHPCSMVSAGIPQDKLVIVYSLKQDLSQ